FYPPKTYLAYTLKPNAYKIPDEYIVKTTYGKKEEKTVTCSINYIENRPHYTIKFGSNSDDFISSNHSPTTAANAYLKAYNIKKIEYEQANNPNISSMSIPNSKMNGIHLFGLHLKQLNRFRENLNDTARIYKPFKDLTRQMQIIRNKSMSNDLFLDFETRVHSNFNSQDKVELNELVFSVNNQSFRVIYNSQSLDETIRQMAIIRAMDQQRITRDAYRVLTNISHDLPPLRSIKDILAYLIPTMVAKKILDFSDPTINIRISVNIFKPESHFTLIIYPGVEKYSILQIAMKSLRAELEDIKNGFIDKEGRYWNIKLYFSADWKFMAICLGHKAANSAEYCLWCPIHKSQNGVLEINGIRQDNWTITKNMNEINRNYQNIPGHNQPPLFPMIPIHNYVVDELHLLLRVTDQLWTLVINELRSTKNYNDMIRKVIVDEMDRIGVKFQFWEDHDTKTWKYTSLMGDDKLKILQNFDFTVIFSLQRATLIRKLWDGFYYLYDDLHNSNITGKDFHQKARSWLQLFLTRSQGSINSPGFVQGLYRPTDVTPYIHVLVYHVSEFIDIHKNVAFNSFSCSAIEKKNHEHVSHFFQKTMKNGGNKSAIIEIMEYENRNNFFYVNDVPLYFEKDTKINIKK
ncbi:14613_t:CDS:2, partial [Gigaspora margarita]